MANLMPGEWDMQPPLGGFGGILSGGNPLFNIGMGILANNSGHYGQLGPALGLGAQEGMKQTMLSRQQAREAQLYQLQMDKYKRQMEQQQKQEEFLKSWGNPNANKTVTSPDTYQNAPQGTDAPNYNMNKVAGGETQVPYFDQNKALQGAVQSGALDFKDYIALTQKDSKTTWQDAGGDLIQMNANGNPTGVTIPKSMAKSFHTVDTGGETLLTDGTQILGRVKKSVSPDAQLSSDTSKANNANTQAENARADLKNDPLGLKKSKSKIFKLDGGGSVNGILDPATNNYYVIKNGKKMWIQE